MLSKNQVKKIVSLSQKKQRSLQNVFVVEGTKSVLDVAAIIHPTALYATQAWLDEHSGLGMAFEVVTEEELKKISQLKTPQHVLALFPILAHDPPLLDNKKGLVLALDDIQDPGNLGTILRLADWFGIETVICSKGCVDMYNPKVVQASMGSIARVQVIYTDLEQFLNDTAYPVYGTFMEGESIYEASLAKNAVVVMGNEGQGISAAVENVINQKITIPCFSKGEMRAESLNVATATAIVCSEFGRR